MPPSTKEDYPAAEAVGRELLGRVRPHYIPAGFAVCLIRQGKYAAAEPVMRECLEPEKAAAWRAKAAPK